jgi:hypothetical protein
MTPRPLLFSLLLFSLLAALVASAAAAPAPWYSWRSKTTGTLACSQTPLGPGWERATGPYRDSRCEKRILTQ